MAGLGAWARARAVAGYGVCLAVGSGCGANSGTASIDASLTDAAADVSVGDSVLSDQADDLGDQADEQSTDASEVSFGDAMDGGGTTLADSDDGGVEPGEFRTTCNGVECRGSCEEFTPGVYTCSCSGLTGGCIAPSRCCIRMGALCVAHCTR